MSMAVNGERDGCIKGAGEGGDDVNHNKRQMRCRENRNVKNKVKVMENFM